MSDKPAQSYENSNTTFKEYSALDLCRMLDDNYDKNTEYWTEVTHFFGRQRPLVPNPDSPPRKIINCDINGNIID